jgi:hypothetical protein
MKRLQALALIEGLQTFVGRSCRRDGRRHVSDALSPLRMRKIGQEREKKGNDQTVPHDGIACALGARAHERRRFSQR